MASRGRRGALNPRFQKPEQPKDGVHASIIKQARKSGQLNISSRNLEEIPDAVWRINLDVPEEGKTVSMDNADDRWWEQTDLLKLIAASNLLTKLSEDIANLPALTVLDVHDNRLDSLPEALGGLENLQKLDVSRNKLTELPGCVCRLRSLKSLHVEYNQLQELPNDLGNLTFLEEFEVSNNALTSLPPGIGYLCKIVKLNLSQNKLQTLPPEIGSMNALRQLDCTNNELRDLPEQIGTLLHLEQLYLRHNNLTRVPVLTECAALKELHLGNNQIQEVTAAHLQQLPAISVLDLRDNKIATLPDEIVNLQSLERLDVTNNDLSALPYALGTLPALKSLVLDGNPMKSIRRDIIMRGTMAVKKYLASRIEETPEVKENGSESGVKDTRGQSGIIGGGGDGVDAHEVSQTKTLDYSGKQCSSIPGDVWQVAAKGEVTIVNLSKNSLTDLPEGIMLVSDFLKELNLSFNRLSSLHSDIGLYLQLQFLDLRNNQLSDLPSDMSSLKELREINLTLNKLTKLPEVLYRLPKLEILIASDNKIDTIDAAGLQQLPMLATLDLQNNSIHQVPPELGLCTQLKSVQLGGNLFKVPRPQILMKGTNALMEHLRSRIVS